MGILQFEEKKINLNSRLLPLKIQLLFSRKDQQFWVVSIKKEKAEGSMMINARMDAC